MDDFEKELKTDFLVEAEGLVDGAEQVLLQLEEEPDNAEAIDELFRAAHNIKGSSKAVGFEEVAEFTHHFEDLLLKIKKKELSPGPQIVTLLLKGKDCIGQMVSALKSDLEAKFDNAELISQFQSLLSGSMDGFDSGAELAPADFNNVEAQSAVEPTEEPSESLPEAEVEKDDEAVAQVSQPASAPPPPKKAVRRKLSEDETIRVKLERIEKLNNVVGELVIVHTVLDQRRFVGIEDDVANKTISQLGKLSKEIQEISMSLRMVPLKQTFQKMSRIVRDTSSALDKKVKLSLDGEKTEIDKTVLEQLGDPLVHIVRNAIDHGLESTEERVQVGKPEIGSVTLKAYHEGSNLIIEASDDGKGIDPQKIKAKAVEKRIIDENTELSNDELIQLIFHPGFSTKEQVTDVSGRGVGMDVVKTNIEALSGKVRVNSTVGSGSTFQIVLPLTLAIIEGMVVKSGTQTYVIPLSQIQESILPSEDSIHSVTGVGECLNLRKEVIPLADIGGTLGLGSNKKAPHEKIAIIVRNNECAFAVQVDDILKQQQVVIKTLGDEIRDKKGFMGSSILGDGRPTFILDLHDLYQASMAKHKKLLKGKPAG